ncbi:MAG: hypothetical protein JXA15_09405 [Spirochaetales bacterium]|nr:hypothetical protein [Spirochaetales bacterium]
MKLATPLKSMLKALDFDYAWYRMKSVERQARFTKEFGIPAIGAGDARRSDLPIDIVIPVIDKDAGTLPLVIDSAREFIAHPIGGIYLVSPKDSPAIRAIAAEKRCELIDEAELVDISPRDIAYVHEGTNRAGWVYQQLLKWSGGRFCKNRHYLVIDSDTVFIRPQAFEFEGRMVFDFCDEFHVPYFKAFEHLFGMTPRATISFTSHHSLIDTELMRELMDVLGKRHGKPWFEAVAGAVDVTEMSSVSDYDNYGQYVAERHPQRMVVRYWANKSFGRKHLPRLDTLRRRYARLYNTISFHSWNVY